MVVAERVIRVPIQVLPVDERNGALDVGLCGHDAGNNNPAGALRRVRRGPIADQHRRAENRTSIRSSGARKQPHAVGSGHDGGSSHNSRSMPAALSRSGPMHRAPSAPMYPLRVPSQPHLRRVGTLRYRFARHLADAFERWEAFVGLRHDSTVSTLHGIADVYCRYLSERSRGLRIPGCAGRTYRECFRTLENANRYVRHEACALAAPIRFRRPPLRGRTMTTEFTPAVRLSPRNATRPDAVYRVSFHTGSWSERERDRFRRGRPARFDLPARGHLNSVREIPDKMKLWFAPQHHQQSVPVPPSFPLEPERSFPAGQ